MRVVYVVDRVKVSFRDNDTSVSVFCGGWESLRYCRDLRPESAHLVVP